MLTTPAKRPERVQLEGQYVVLRPLSEEDSVAMWEAGAGEHALWRYMSSGPYDDFDSFRQLVRAQSDSNDSSFFAILEKCTGRAVGMTSLMRIEPVHRVIEVGHILYTPALQKTRAATEAMYLLAKYCFEELGYRRYEWKCNALNEPSRKAALRLGFTFEGIFRQHMIIKGQNRDTAWFSMLDGEWPERKRRFETWLQPSNFDAHQKQKSPL